MGKMKKTQTTKVWGRNALAPFQAWIFKTAKPTRLSMCLGYICMSGSGKLRAEKPTVIISVKFHSVLRFLQVTLCIWDREREGEVSHCPVLKCTNPELGFQICVCVCTFVWSGTSTHTQHWHQQPWRQHTSNMGVWVIIVLAPVTACPFPNQAWFHSRLSIRQPHSRCHTAV